MAKFDKILKAAKKATEQVDDKAARLAKEEAEIAADILQDPGMSRMHRQIDATEAFVDPLSARNSVSAFEEAYNPNFDMVGDVTKPSNLPAIRPEKGLVPRNDPNFALGEGVTSTGKPNFTVEPGTNFPEARAQAGLPVSTSALDNAIDVTPIPVTDKASFLQKYGKKLGTAGLVGAGILGISQLAPEQQTASTQPQVPPQVPPQQDQAPVLAEPQASPPEPAQAAKSNIASKSKLQTPSIVPGTPSKQEDVMKFLDFGTQFKDTASALQEQQEARNRAALMNNLAKAGNRIGSAIAGVRLEGNEAFDDLTKEADIRLAQFKERMEKEKNDPNSPISKGMRDMAKKMFGIEIKGDASADVLMKVVPQLGQHYQFEANKEFQREQLKQQASDRAFDRNIRERELAIRAKSAENKTQRDPVTEHFQKKKIEEQITMDKESRKERVQIDKDIQSTEKLLDDLKQTKNVFEKYSKSLTGSGPIATVGGMTKYLSSDAQMLDSQFKKLNLDTMSKMFQGMSKAVDSEGERRAFEAAQPALTNDDNVNRALLDERIKATTNLLEKQKNAARTYDKSGSFEEARRSAVQSSKPKTIFQNGFEYTLNEETGEYE